MNFLEEFCGDSLSVRTLSSKRCSAATRCHEEIFWQRSCGHRNSSSIEEGRMVHFVVGFVGLGLFGWSGTFRPEYQRLEIFQGRIGSAQSWLVFIGGKIGGASVREGVRECV